MPSAPPSPKTEPTYLFSDPPPPASLIPRPPPGRKKGAAGLRGIKPRALELSYLGPALEDLRAFHDYTATFGVAAPEYAVLLKSLERAEGWSAMRAALADWDSFCADMEARSWRDSRRHLATLGPAFALAEAAAPELATRHSSLLMLVRAMKMISQKGVATRKANAQAVREGREPLRGKKLKAARRAAEKEALKQLQAREAAALASASPPKAERGSGAKRGR